MKSKICDENIIERILAAMKLLYSLIIQQYINIIGIYPISIHIFFSMLDNYII